VGQKCYVFSEVGASNAPSQNNISRFVATFDTLITVRLTELYGPIPDAIDNDPRIFILFIAPTWWAGYFDPTHQMSDSFVQQKWNIRSNEKEMIFASIGSPYDDPTEIIAHEFGHMLHWGQDHSPEPPDNPVKYWEDTWIDEGFSTFSPIYLFTMPYYNNVMQDAFFATNPALSLIYFLDNSNYSSSNLWMVFMYEHYDKELFIKTLIKDQLNGIPSVNNTLKNLGYTETFDDVFQQWVIANFLDDTLYDGGKYGYKLFNFTGCRILQSFDTFPASGNDSLPAYSANYFQFTSQQLQPVKIQFYGTDTSKSRVALILKNRATNEIRGIKNIVLDQNNKGIFVADSFGSDYDEIIMVVMNVDPKLPQNATANYNFVIEPINNPVIDQPDKGSLDFQFKSNENILSITSNVTEGGSPTTKLIITDILGRIALDKSDISLPFEMNTSFLPQGMYLVKAVNGNSISFFKFLEY
jgi:hypothetical protein